MKKAKRLKFTGIAEQLRAAVLASGMTSYSLGKAAGVQPTKIDRFKSGAAGLSLENAVRLAEAMGLELRKKR